MKKTLLLLLLLVSCCSQPTAVFDAVSFSVELAVTPEELSKGLMFRDNLPEKHGMLFIFDDTAQRSFWMKNTLIPLDIIFLDGNFVVVNIEYAVPCRADPCPSYVSEAPAKYVLEINANLSEKYNIKKGSKMILSE